MMTAAAGASCLLLSLHHHQFFHSSLSLFHSSYYLSSRNIKHRSSSLSLSFFLSLSLSFFLSLFLPLFTFSVPEGERRICGGFLFFIVISIIQKTKGEGKRRCARFFSGSFAVITARFAAKLCTPYFNRETYRVAKKKKGTIRRAKQNSFSRLKSLTVIASRETHGTSSWVHCTFMRCSSDAFFKSNRSFHVHGENRAMCAERHTCVLLFMSRMSFEFLLLFCFHEEVGGSFVSKTKQSDATSRTKERKKYHAYDCLYV